MSKGTKSKYRTSRLAGRYPQFNLRPRRKWLLLRKCFIFARTATATLSIAHDLFLLKLNHDYAFLQRQLDIGDFADGTKGVIHVLPLFAVVSCCHALVKHRTGD